MNHNFYIPHTAQSKESIHSVWQVQRFNPSATQEHIIPKGIVEIIFNFSEGSSIPAQVGNNHYQLGNCFINGFNTATIRLQPPQHQTFFGVRLHPLAVKKLFKTPASVFADTPVDLTLVDSSIHSLWQQLANQTEFNSRAELFCRWIEKKSFNWQPQDNMMNQFFSSLNQHDLSVKELANSLCYSPRQLSRKIGEATGMNTEQLLLYKKYLHAVHLMHDSNLPLTQIAYQSHFSDQSHFIKSFKGFTELTPGEYYKNKSAVKGHIFGQKS